ncbi:hypothetical protein [Streptomyces sp. CMB-StM0423]|uniref:hypothetical protein n=1 Tax=Streptomyces sp. CMB-StM0423 TaxID=2059884 RepID=UPI000C70CB21|nr:hypothetical protein [Streptomyces sp. CMB-StM0423]AUH42248.1 hypothetical protein CXR04_20455 [Streptomyces sp. CMB-StM0423]
MELTAAHWTYLAGVVVIIGVMIARRNVVVPAVIATFFTAWFYSGSLVKGLAAIFSASLTAAGELFSIFLIIALITALLGAMRAMGAERRMVVPFRALMRNGRMAFVAIAGVTYFISLFFWPTPAVPLIGAILLPAAIRAGLPAISAAAAIAIAGQGMALSSDYVIQVAPGLSAKAAGVETSAVADRAMVLSVITGVVALTLVYLKGRRSFGTTSEEHQLRWEAEAEALSADGGGASLGGTGAGRTARTAAASGGSAGAATKLLSPPGGAGSGGSGTDSATDPDPDPDTASGPGSGPGSGTDRKPGSASGPGSGSGGTPGEPVRRSRAFALIVPLTFAAIVGYMLLGKFTGAVTEVQGGEAAGLVGGVAMLLLFAAVFCCDGKEGLTTAADHVVDGLVFAFKAMGVVVPIAGFFFLGNVDFITEITGVQDDNPPALLFDLVTAVDQYIPDIGFIVAFAILIIGMITGLEGSGFAGLPLTGSLSGSLGPAADVDPATLAAVGQMGSVWTGGGVLIAWSSLLAVAGVARVPVQEVVRHCFVPVVAGLVTATALATVLF